MHGYAREDAKARAFTKSPVRTERAALHPRPGFRPVLRKVYILVFAKLVYKQVMIKQLATRSAISSNFKTFNKIKVITSMLYTVIISQHCSIPYLLNT